MSSHPAFKAIQQKNLSEMLLALNTKNDLLEFADLFGLPYKQSLKKQALAEIIEYKLLEHPEVLMHVLPKKELLSLQKLVHAGGYLKTKNELDIFELEQRAIVYRAKQKVDLTQKGEPYFEYVLTGDLQRVLHKTIDKMLQNTDLDLWDRNDHLFVGLLELYGVLSQHQFFNLWEKYTGEPLDMLDFFKMLRKRSLVRGLCNPFYIDNKLCLSNANADNPYHLFEAVQKRKDLDYHLYSLETLLLSSESYLSIIDERSLLPLVELLDQMNEENEFITTLQLTGLWVMYQNEAPHGELIKFLANQDNFNTLKNINQLVTAVTNFTNALPNWLLKGHTPNELHSKNPINLKDPLLRKQVNDSFSKKFPDEPSALDSIWNKIDQPDNVVPFTPRPTTGRNDPCPCGSGKKYKKCCGAN